MEFLIKFAQAHESFRLPEIKALAIVEGVEMTVMKYDLDVRLTQPCPDDFSHKGVVTVLCCSVTFSRVSAAPHSQIYTCTVYS